MRILEIIQEYDVTDVRIKRRKPSFDYDTMQDRSEREAEKDDTGVQQGWYSGGQTNPRDPHEFVKKPHLTTLLNKDAYYHYIKEIANLKKAGYHNPFFPQVYNVDITQDPKGNQRPRYRIEKLQPGDSYPPEALEGMYERLFNDDINKKDFSNYSNPSNGIWSEIAHEVNKAVERSNYNNIKDDQLREALMLIDKILTENPTWNVDLHINNIRIRGSSKGPHLVLMDPISDGGDSIPDYDDVRYGPDNKSKVQQQKPPARSDWSTFKNFAMGRATKKKETPAAKTPDYDDDSMPPWYRDLEHEVKQGHPLNPKKRTGLGTLLKRRLDQNDKPEGSFTQRVNKVKQDLRARDQDKPKAPR